MVWIDQLLYDRISFELNLPRKTRTQLADTVARYPEDSLPGYPVSGADKDPQQWELPRKYHVTGSNQTFQPSTGNISLYYRDVFILLKHMYFNKIQYYCQKISILIIVLVKR